MTTSKLPVGFQKFLQLSVLLIQVTTASSTSVKEKEELKTKLENFQSSSKGLSKLLNSQMSTRDKSGLGYGDQVHNGVLSYENEVFQSVFDSRSSDVKDSPVHDRFANVEGMHAVPPPMTGNYMPSGPDREVDDSMFTYGPKQSKTSESDTQTSNYDSCESNSSAETLEFVHEPVVVEPKVVSQPKVLNDEPIIEEWHSDCDDEEIVVEPKEIKRTVKPGFKKVEPINARKETVRPWNNCMTNKHGLGFTKKVCFVCRSPNHLIKDCNFHENRMARKPVLNNDGKGSKLAIPEQTATGLAIPGQTATGKESSNPFMAGSLPKTIHLCDSLQSDEDSFELIELMILCTNFLTMVCDLENLKNHSSDNEESLGEDASKQGSIHDAYAIVTKEQKVDDDKETTQEVRKSKELKICSERDQQVVSELKKRWPTAQVLQMLILRPKAEVNTVKASASWVWKPKHEELDHVFKSNSASKTLTRYDYVDALGRYGRKEHFILPKGRISTVGYEVSAARRQLAIPGQTTTGKESSNPFMAGSLPKTKHFCDSLQSDKDSFELIELMILCTNFLTMVRDLENLKTTYLIMNKVWVRMHPNRGGLMMQMQRLPSLMRLQMMLETRTTRFQTTIRSEEVFGYILLVIKKLTLKKLDD
ncbi:hypothetical protein Tco_0942515 [Tanacetum coccineum]